MQLPMNTQSCALEFLRGTTSSWPFKSWTSPFTFLVILENVLCFVCELSSSNPFGFEHLFGKKFFFLLLVIHCNAYFAAWVKLWETPALSSQQDGVAAALGPAFEGEGNWESCQKVREWEFETEWDSEQAFIYATIFNPTPSRLSQGFLSRTLRKQAWLGFLSARWAVQSQGRIALWWPGTDSKRKKELKSWHIFAWLVVSGASDFLKGS